MENLGTADTDIAKAVMHHLMEATQDSGHADPNRLRWALAHLQGLQPKDEMELMLAVQMTLVHLAVAKTARHLHGADTIEKVAVHSSALSKLSRTFSTQMETLKKHRSKGEQRVIVEHQHIHVYPGGQAVVGTVNHGGSGEGATENEVQPHERDEQLRISERSAVPCDIQANGVPVQGAGQEGLESLQVPRRRRRPALRAVK